MAPNRYTFPLAKRSKNWVGVLLLASGLSCRGCGAVSGTVKPLQEIKKQTTTARAPEARRRESQWKPDPERPKPPTLVRLWRDRRDEQRREMASKARIGMWDGVATPMTAAELAEHEREMAELDAKAAVRREEKRAQDEMIEKRMREAIEQRNRGGIGA